ncbi:MAG: hypothetical protein ACREGB_01685, partial [Candidatus Saccharimonadales bacterium]
SHTRHHQASEPTEDLPRLYVAAGTKLESKMTQYNHTAMIEGVVMSFLRQAKSVYYLDDNRERREYIKELTIVYGKLQVDGYAPSGRAAAHAQVLIMVNPHRAVAAWVREALAIPGYYDNLAPMIVRIQI